MFKVLPIKLFLLIVQYYLFLTKLAYNMESNTPERSFSSSSFFSTSINIYRTSDQRTPNLKYNSQHMRGKKRKKRKKLQRIRALTNHNHASPNPNQVNHPSYSSNPHTSNPSIQQRCNLLKLTRSTS